jgi:hypothetical protein
MVVLVMGASVVVVGVVLLLLLLLPGDRGRDGNPQMQHKRLVNSSR